MRSGKFLALVMAAALGLVACTKKSADVQIPDELSEETSSLSPGVAPAPKEEEKKTEEASTAPEALAPGQSSGILGSATPEVKPTPTLPRKRITKAKHAKLKKKGKSKRSRLAKRSKSKRRKRHHG